MEIIDGKSGSDESRHSPIVWGICWIWSALVSDFLIRSSSQF
jgi:hypothetical protein